MNTTIETTLNTILSAANAIAEHRNMSQANTPDDVEALCRAIKALADAYVTLKARK